MDLPPAARRAPRSLRARRPRPAESRGDRRARARALAGFFATGALLSTAVLLLPGWEQVNVGGIAATIVAAALGAGGLLVFAERANRGFIHVQTLSGTVLIAACQVFAGGGSATAMYAMLYIWVILHCSLFFTRPVVVAHLALTTLAHVGALVWLGEFAALASRLTLTLGTQVAAAIVVGSLAAKQRDLADTDSLTGLPNRRVVDRTLEWALDDRRRHVAATPPCVAVLDLDGFKAFNDRAGHAAGDRLLADVADRWRSVLRGTDTLARTGGDEFLLVMTECDLEGAERVVRRLITMTPEGVSCSAGLARWDPREGPRSLVERADRALYRAKADGPVAIAHGVDRVVADGQQRCSA